MIFKRNFVVVLLLFVLTNEFSQAREFGIQQYQPPQEQRVVSPKYPKSRQQKGQSGMVSLSYMVDKNGRAKEIFVLDSTHKSFEKPAIKAISKYTFLPAKLDSEPVESRASRNVFFMIEGESSSVPRVFSKRLKDLRLQLQSDSADLENIKKGIDELFELKGLNIYSLFWLNILRWEYASKANVVSLQQRSTEQLVVLDSRLKDAEGGLNQSLRSTISKEQVLVDIKLGKFGSALSRYKDLKALSEDPSTELESVMSKIIATLNGNKVFTQQFEVGSRSFWIDELSRRQLSVVADSGSIDKLKFRCEAKFFEVEHNDENEYQIPENWGSCSIQIIGDPMTQGRLIQFSTP